MRISFKGGGGGGRDFKSLRTPALWHPMAHRMLLCWDNFRVFYFVQHI